MKKTATASTAASIDKIKPKTKSQLVINVLTRSGGATVEEMSATAGWLPHSTRSFMTGLKKKGHVIESDKVEGVRRYLIVSKGSA